MKRIRKLSIAIILVSVSTIFSLSACTSTNKVNANAKIDLKDIKIGVTLYKQDDAFISTIAKNIEKSAKEKESENDCKITVDFVDAKGSVVNQDDQVDRFIKQNYDVICVNLVDRTSAATIIDKAKTAKIPVIFFNREPVEEDMDRWNKVYYVGAQAEQSAEMEANIIINAYNREIGKVDKNGDGKIQYVMLEGEQGHQDSLIRTEYCIKTVSNSGIELEKLADDTANWLSSQSSTKMTQWIKEFGDKIEVVFSNNDDMALGAIHALNEENIKEKPLVVGIDGLPEALEAVKNGEMEGTVINDSKLQASSILEIAYRLSTNEDVSTIDGLEEGKYIKTNHAMVTKDNVNMFLEN